MKFNMRTVFLFLAGITVLAAQCEPAHGIEVRYKVSRVHGLLKFVLAIAGEPHEANGLKELYVRSSYHDDAHGRLLASWDSVRSALSRSLPEGAEPIPFRDHGTEVISLVKTQAIFAANLHDLSERTLGMMPMNEHIALFKVLAGFDSAYEALVWKPHSRELRVRLRQLEKMARKAGLSSMFTKAADFYRASWPSDVAFTIGLYAIPWLENFKNSTKSSSMGTVEEHGVQTGAHKAGDDSLASDFGVIFHELCHSLYASQSDAVMRDLAAAFAAAPPRFSNLAQAWINEALATALGNGWAYSRANGGKLDSSRWYNNPTIDGFSHTLYPEVVSRIGGTKTFDSEFVLFAVDAFGRTFPDLIYSVEEIFNRVTVIHNRSVATARELRLGVEAEFSPYALGVSAPIAHPETVAEARKGSDSLVVILGPGEFAELAPMEVVLPFLGQHKSELENLGPRQVWGGVDDKGRAYLVIRADSDTEVNQALRKLHDWKKIDPKTPVKAY